MLENVKQPLVVGLIASPERISQLRENRILGLNAAAPNLAYVDKAAIADEIAYTRKLCAKHGWPMIDVTRRSIEETAAAIMALHREPRAARDVAERASERRSSWPRAARRVGRFSPRRLAFTSTPATLDERAIETPLIAGGAAPAEIARRLPTPRRRRSAAACPMRWSSAPTRRSIATAIAAPSPRPWRRRGPAAAACRPHPPPPFGRRRGARRRRRAGAISTARRSRCGRCRRRDRRLSRRGRRGRSEERRRLPARGRGDPLFDRIEGDYFTILGLPLLPLLAYLRSQGAIE